MDKKKILIIVGVLLLLGGVYKFVLSGDPPPPGPKPHVTGVPLPMDKEFMINLEGGQVAKVNITLLLDEKDPGVAAAETYAAAAAGPIPLHPQNYLIRAVITDALTNLSASSLTNSSQKSLLLKSICKRINKETDAKVLKVEISDSVIA